MSLPSSIARPGIAVFGQQCRFTDVVLAELLQAGANVAGTFLVARNNPGVPREVVDSGRELPMAYRERFPDPTSRALEGGIPVYQLGTLNQPETIAWFADRGLDLLLTACFSRRVPSPIIQTFRIAALNLHPTLLPEKRGPDPSFWIFREGSSRGGITLHHLAERFDAGPIVDQRAVNVFEGMTEPEYEAETARAGAELVLRALTAAGAAPLPSRAQDEAAATYAPNPLEEDFELPADMSVRTAYRFIRGIAWRRPPFLARRNGERIYVFDAAGYRSGEDVVGDIASAGLTALDFADGRLYVYISGREPDTDEHLPALGQR